jgi:[acyl-carrier-protein] S-malonyltransferase
MGASFIDEFPETENFFDEASDVLGKDLKKLCLEGSSDTLTSTEWAQPAILAVSAVAYKLFNEKRPDIEVVAGIGHSLGEYSALYVAGSLSFTQAISLVHQRGNFINSVSREVGGTMAAIIGLDEKAVREICDEVSEQELVEPANFNSPSQIVITGTDKGIKLACEIAKERGAKRAIELQVSGPFHSSMLKKAGDRMLELLKKEDIKETEFPIISNVSAKPHTSVDRICELLGKQVYSPVLFTQSVENVWTGEEIFIEFGGKVSGGLVKRTLRGAKVFSIEDVEGLEKTIDGITNI